MSSYRVNKERLIFFQKNLVDTLVIVEVPFFSTLITTTRKPIYND